MIEYVILGIVIAIIGIMLLKEFMPVMWKHKRPKDRLKDVISEFGKPDYICKKVGGFALWKEDTLMKRGFPLYEICIKDEELLHTKPKEHMDFLYMGYRIDIPEDKLPLVLNLSKSVWYDRLKKVVWARCHFSGATIATLNEIIKIINDKSGGTDEEYATSIFKTVKTMQDHYDPDAYKIYLENLTLNMMPYSSNKEAYRLPGDPIYKVPGLNDKKRSASDIFSIAAKKRPKVRILNPAAMRRSIPSLPPPPLGDVFSSAYKVNTSRRAIPGLYNKKIMGRSLM